MSFYQLLHLDAFPEFAHLRQMIYKIFRQAEWLDFQKAGMTDGAPIDLADKFIHFSTAKQVQETADKHFAGVTDLFLAAFDEAELGDALKWEVSRGGADFPHLYRSLNLNELIWCVPIPLTDTGHILPDDLT